MFRPSFCFIAFFALMSWFGEAMAFDIGAGTTAIRDRSNPNILVLTVQLKGVNPTDRQNLGILQDDASFVQQAIANTLDICLSASAASCSETDIHVRWAIERRPTPQVDNDYLSKTQIANFDSTGTILTQDVSDLNLWEYSIRIVIQDTAAQIPVGTKVLLRFFPDKVSSNGNKDFNTVTAKLGSGVRDAPAIRNILGTPKSLTVQFTNSPTVTFMDNTQGAPGGVVAVLIPQPTNASTIPTTSYEADPIAVAPQDGSCPLTVDLEAETCSVNCAANTSQSINIAGIAAAGLRSATTAKPTDQNIGFTGVSIAEGPYAVVISYLPEGTGFSCAIGNATDAGTLVQLTGGSEPKPGEPNCFIATAAYGTALDPHIDVLRWFRDRYLLQTSWGKSFVLFYYKNSPPIAQWIAGHEWARTLTRGALWAPVMALEAFKNHRLLTLSLLAALIASLVAVRRLRRAAI